MQASNLQQAVSADTIELKTVKIVLGTPPIRYSTVEREGSGKDGRGLSKL